MKAAAIIAEVEPRTLALRPANGRRIENDLLVVRAGIVSLMSAARPDED
jgi:hypothetical protein